jgi:hypothetical protein
MARSHLRETGRVGDETAGRYRTAWAGRRWCRRSEVRVDLGLAWNLTARRMKCPTTVIHDGHRRRGAGPAGECLRQRPLLTLQARQHVGGGGTRRVANAKPMISKPATRMMCSINGDAPCWPYAVQMRIPSRTRRPQRARFGVPLYPMSLSVPMEKLVGGAGLAVRWLRRRSRCTSVNVRSGHALDCGDQLIRVAGLRQHRTDGQLRRSLS